MFYLQLVASMTSSLLDRAAAAGLRNTKFRQTLCGMIDEFGEAKPVTAFLEELRVSYDPKVHKTTVYRELEILERAGIVEKIILPDGIAMYGRIDKHHHHVICKKCDSIEDVAENDLLDSFEKKIEKKTGFKIMNHSLEFFGLCRNCS